MRFSSLAASAAFLFLSSASTARALDIERFDTDSSITNFDSVVPKISSTTTSAAIGGVREQIVTKSSGGGAVSANVGGGAYFHSQDSGVTGNTLLLWDGVGNQQLDGNGLGGINLFQDIAPGVTPSIVLENVDPDLANAILEVTIYDAGNASATKWSRAQVTLVSLAPTTVTIPFTDFTISGPAGAANFGNVGAISLRVIGNDPNIDLKLDRVRTNGKCELIPNSAGKVIDECGVCGGDGSSCADCKGVPNGPAVPGTSCTTGQIGLCNPGTYQSNCSCKRTYDPKPELCDEVDNDCDGIIDDGFSLKNTVCGIGDNGCTFEGKYVCDANGGLFCDAQLKQNQLIDCEKSRGCDGVPASGLVKDECGVCGGDGKSCRDCSGELNGIKTLDRCNECGGDGLSCLGCQTKDIRKLQTDLDSGAKKQERVARKALLLAEKRTLDPKLISRIKSLRARIHELQVRNWTISWIFPSDSTTCTNKTFCVSTSNVELITEYRGHSLELLNLTQQSARLLEQIYGRRGMGAAYVRAGRKLHAENMKLADQVPLTNEACF